MPWRRAHSVAVRAAPVATVLVLALLVTWVWLAQIKHQRRAHARHTSDVCYQASRRIQVLVEQQLRGVRVDARIWSILGPLGGSRDMFKGLSSTLLEELPGCRSVQYVGPGGAPRWSNAAPGWKGGTRPPGDERALLAAARAAGGAVISAPVPSPAGEHLLYIAHPIGQGDAGVLVLEMNPRQMIGVGFEVNIRLEFNLKLEDGKVPLFSFPTADWSSDGDGQDDEHRLFTVGDRTWRLTIRPKQGMYATAGWLERYSIPLLGYFLALAMALLVHLLASRMALYRAARDQALTEVAERVRAQKALDQAISRYTLLSRKVLMAQEEERGRISRDLHDELGQILTALHLEVDWLQSQAGDAPDEVQTAFANTVEMVESAAAELRRICKGLRPPLLDDLGLKPASRMLIEEEQARTGLETEVKFRLNEDELPIDPEVALCVYRVLQEALHNIRRHASASCVNISLTASESALHLSVYDDGIGFDMGAVRGTHPGFGIAGMRERAYLVSGTIEVRSEPHQGTRVDLRIPLGSENDGEPKEGS